jgi:hypothetical protein
VKERRERQMSSQAGSLANWTNLNIALLVKMGDLRHASRLAHGSR